MPILTQGLARNANHSSGAESLLNVLTQKHTGSISQATEQNPSNMGLINQLLDQDGDGSISDDLANTGLNMLKDWMSNK
ncbi:MAG TPA: hypothetical protein PKC21_04400 [Oligoflexia bacterium]|nr:hypothetical protein [Oligoflexia bacterium]HMR24578.1 hypothetical protein [Oligoflexia bacterium]